MSLMACKMNFERQLCEFDAKNNEIHRENSQYSEPDWMGKISKLEILLELICNFYFMPINSLRSIKFDRELKNKCKTKHF